MADPARGDIWLADLDPTLGHEQAGRRPVLVVSVDTFNHGPAGLAIVVPLTSRGRGIRSHVWIDAPEGGLRVTSVALCEAVRSIDQSRLISRWGAVTDATMAHVEDWLRTLMDL